jgi:hypothetical protein
MPRFVAALTRPLPLEHYQFLSVSSAVSVGSAWTTS